MIRTARAFVLLSLLAAPALAATVYVDVPSGVNLEAGKACPVEGADVALRDTTIEAPHGIRLEKMREFSTTVPIILNASYVVRSSRGAEYRIWVHRVQGGQRMVEIRPGGERPLNVAKLQGRFKQVSFRIDGEVADSRYPDLRLYSDGGYRMGSASGRYEVVSGMLAMDGYYGGTWGRGDMTDEGQTVTFRYSRGGLSFEVVYNRVGDLEEVAAR